MTATPRALSPASPGAQAPLHLIIGYAAPRGNACRQALPGLALPRLSQLLRRLAPLPPAPVTANATGEPPRQAEHTLSLPHERAYAQALGLPAEDGRIPWAAWAAASEGAWAWFIPCHWAVGRDHIAMRPPEALALTADESRQLLAAMQPYFAEDGLAVEANEAAAANGAAAPLRWRARGEMLRDLTCASLDRVVDQRVDDWLPRTPAARPLRRLQQEMQMLLYTHPVNEAREQAGRLTVNSFWVEGAGALPTGWAGPADPAASAAPGAGDASAVDAALRLDTRLREAALQDDAAAWAGAWQQLDAQALPALIAALDAGQPVRLTLAGERAAITYESAPRGWLQRLAARWRAPTPAQVLEAL